MTEGTTMNNPRRDQADTGKRGPGMTITHEAHGAVPRQPHERDESADTQAPEASGLDVGRRAHADVQQGQQDTDRGPVLDKVYNEQVRTDKTPMRD
jgi:hypothetical protein